MAKDRNSQEFEQTLVPNRADVAQDDSSEASTSKKGASEPSRRSRLRQGRRVVDRKEKHDNLPD
jgi:hypothetical protein